MAERHAFRYVNEWVGSLILITGLVLVGLIVQAGRVHDWFHPRMKLLVLLPEAGSFGLTEGADVFVLGLKAGEVKTLEILPSARMQANVAIRRKFTPLIRADSTVTIRKRFGVAGDAYLEITKGTGAPLTGTLPTIRAVAETAPTETIQLVVDELRSELLPVIRDVRESVQALTTGWRCVPKAAGFHPAIPRNPA